MNTNQFPFYGQMISTYQGYQWCPYYPYSTFQPFLTPPLPCDDVFVKKEDDEPIFEINLPKQQKVQSQKPTLSIADNTRKKVNQLKPSSFSNKNHSSKKSKGQKKDRNMPSNICKFFITFLNKHTSLEKYIGISSAGQKVILKNCLKEVKTHLKEGQGYIRPVVILQMCQGRILGEEESRIFRILFERFMKTEVWMIISSLKNARKKEKLAYFRICRRFLRNFLK